MSLLEMVLWFLVVPIASLLLIAAVTLVRPSARGRRWRSGEAWDHEPVWWMANPRGSGVPEPVVEAVEPGAHDVRTRQTARGGARGTW